MKELKIRFNTENTDGVMVWRVLIDGKEHLASNVNIITPSYTTKDTLEDGRVKWHISAKYDELVWNGDKLTVK